MLSQWREWERAGARLAACLLWAFGAAAAEYMIAPAPGARLQLEVHKTGLMSGKIHVFTFESYSGELHYDEASPGRSTVSFTVDNASLVCHDTWVDEKDRRKILRVAQEAMDTRRHPRMTFRSESVVSRPGGGYDVSGPLTIKGIAKPVVIHVTVERGGQSLRVRGGAVLRRADYGVNPPSPVPFGLIGNKEEMPVQFDLRAKPK